MGSPDRVRWIDYVQLGGSFGWTIQSVNEDTRHYIPERPLGVSEFNPFFVALSSSRNKKWWEHVVALLLAL